MGEEVHIQYDSLAQSLEEFIGKTFNEWVLTVEKELSKRLEVPLMGKHSSRYNTGSQQQYLHVIQVHCQAAVVLYTISL